MNDSNPASDKTGDSASRQLPMVIYVLYLVGFLTSGITTLIGVVLAYVFRREAPAWIQTHYTFQIRTFWLALLVGLLGVVLSLVFIGVLILLALLVWMVVRCAVGLTRLSDYKPIPSPESLWTGR